MATAYAFDCDLHGSNPKYSLVPILKHKLAYMQRTNWVEFHSSRADAADLTPYSEQVVQIEQRRLNGHELFRALIKGGCSWQGDITSRKWSECLFFSERSLEAVERTLSMYEEGVDYRRDGFSVFIS